MGRLSPEQQGSRGNAGPRALAVLRAAWGCDCDGRSHRKGSRVGGTPAATVERHAERIASVTGHRPPTCPWRSFYSPLVRHALELSVDADGHYIMATLGDDPPVLVTDALRTFRIARAAGDRFVQRWLKSKNGPPGGGSGPASRPGGFVSMKRRPGRRRRHG